MCAMIMLQYEEARNKELGRFENTTPASDLCNGLVIFRSGYACHPKVHKGTARESYICNQTEICQILLYSVIPRRCILLSVGRLVRRWWAMVLAYQMIMKFPPITEKYIYSALISSSSSVAANSNTKTRIVSTTAMWMGSLLSYALCLESS